MRLTLWGHVTTVALGGRTCPKKTGHTAVAPPTDATPMNWCSSSSSACGGQRDEGTDTRPCPGVCSWCPGWEPSGALRLAQDEPGRWLVPLVPWLDTSGQPCCCFQSQSDLCVFPVSQPLRLSLMYPGGGCWLAEGSHCPPSLLTCLRLYRPCSLTLSLFPSDGF